MSARCGSAAFRRASARLINVDKAYLIPDSEAVPYIFHMGTPPRRFIKPVEVEILLSLTGRLGNGGCFLGDGDHSRYVVRCLNCGMRVLWHYSNCSTQPGAGSCAYFSRRVPA